MKALKYFTCILLFCIQSLSAQNFWQQTNGPYGEVDGLFLTRSNYILAITHWDGLQWSSDNGESWKNTNITGADSYSIETINDSIFIAGKEHIYISNDFGNTWFIPTDFGILGNHSIQYDSTSQTVYAGSESWANGICGIYYSNDSAQNWELLHSFPITSTRQSINALWVTSTNKIILVNVIYAWPIGVHSQFLRSSDSGETWELIVEGSNNLIYQIIEDISSNLYAICNNGLMVSEDEGKTWVVKSVPGWTILAIDYSGRIYLGPYYSYDKGDTWFTLPFSGIEGFLNDMVINHSNRLYAATSEGIFYGDADSIVVTVEKNEPLKTFYLSQNYPNPFNPVTSIQYVVSSRQFVTLKVYDVLGNEVATLVNEEKQPGTYEVEFNTSSLKPAYRTGRHLPSSGVYFYQLKAGDYIETKKMILLR